MKNKTIFLLRHGQTDLNKHGRVQGRGVDSSINEIGKQQSKLVYKAFRNTPLDSIYTSSLVRTKQTIEPFHDRNIPIKSLDGFDEISWGNQEGKEATLEAKTLYQQTIEGWRNGKLELNVGGGENPTQVMERQRVAMNEVLKNKDTNILICMHGRAMRILICWLLNYPLNFMDGFPHENCAYYTLKTRNDSFFVSEFNKTSHLL